jgi:hypothetical protein
MRPEKVIDQAPRPAEAIPQPLMASTASLKPRAEQYWAPSTNAEIPEAFLG